MAPEAPEGAEDGPAEDVGPIVDPGPELRRADLTKVRVREAIVRRNHARTESSKRRASSTRRGSSASRSSAPRLVRVDFVRARDASLKVEGVCQDTFTLVGRASGHVPSTFGARAAGCTAPTRASLAVGIDGEIFSVRLEENAPAALCAARIAERLQDRYVVEVELDRAQAVVRLVRPRLSSSVC